jgi:hypothetical protein
MVDDPPLPVVLRRADAVTAGLSRHQIAHRLRSGQWLRLGYGIYAVAALYAVLPAREQHLIHVAAALLNHGEGHAASHLSAAAIYNWALPLTGAGRPTLTRAPGAGPTRRRNVVVQVASLRTQDTTMAAVQVAGRRLELAATRPARTVADNLRHLSVPDGVALGDSALRSGRVSWAEVAAELDRQASWPFASRGRRSLLLLDPRRETWLESLSFATFVLAGCPCPEPQVTVLDPAGGFVARVDGWLEEEAVALEADGRTKYRADLGTLPADLDAATEVVATAVQRRLIAQNERERRLLDLGLQVVRWGTADITRAPQRVLAAIAAARRRGDRARFIGTLLHQPAPAWLDVGSANALLH